MKEFLPNTVGLPGGVRAVRCIVEPWFFWVYGMPKNEQRLVGVPGVTYDGYDRRWHVPEEIVAMFLMEEKA